MGWKKYSLEGNYPARKTTHITEMPPCILLAQSDVRKLLLTLSEKKYNDIFWKSFRSNMNISFSLFYKRTYMYVLIVLHMDSKDT